MIPFLPPALLPAGILLPESFLYTPFFRVLATFVAINTVVYVALAIVMMLPKIDVRKLFPRRYKRSETRSIYPDGPL